VLRSVDVHKTSQEMAQADAGLAGCRDFDAEVWRPKTRVEIDYSGCGVASVRVQ